MTPTDPGAGQPGPTGADPATIAVYEDRAGEWVNARTPSNSSEAADLGARAADRAEPRADLGCGPGWHTSALGSPAVALDASRAMLDLAAEHAPEAIRVQADLARLPFAPGSIGAALATKAFVHLDARHVPRALADLHRSLASDAPVALSFFGSGGTAGAPTQASTSFTTDSFPGRRFSLWNTDDLDAVLVGAGFDIEPPIVKPRTDAVPDIAVRGVRLRTLPDTVGPGMRLLVCGLNPSLHAADAGIGFVTPGNRFWPAAMAAGLVSADRDPFHALDHHGIGMTDMVKRSTRRADELATSDYVEGLARLERLVGWLAPDAVCFVGLAGYRAARDRSAVAGLQPESLGGRPAYVMPSTSGLNAHSRLDDLTEHLRAARRLAKRSSTAS